MAVFVLFYQSVAFDLVPPLWSVQRPLQETGLSGCEPYYNEKTPGIYSTCSQTSVIPPTLGLGHVLLLVCRAVFYSLMQKC